MAIYSIDVDQRTREENITLRQIRRTIPAQYLRPHALRAFGLPDLTWWRRTPFLKKIEDKGCYVLESRTT